MEQKWNKIDRDTSSVKRSWRDKKLEQKLADIMVVHENFYRLVRMLCPMSEFFSDNHSETN